jgi:hypothetical protein
MDSFEQHKLRIADITREANYSLWNALLTLNGVLVSVFSVAAVFTTSMKIILVTITVASMLAALLLILNFRSTRNIYQKIGRVDPDHLQSLSEVERQNQIDDSARAYSMCNLRENVTHAILVIQGILILALLLAKT